MKSRLLAHASSARPGPPIAWDETPCLLCGHDDAELVLEAPDPLPTDNDVGLMFAVVRCRNCNLFYTNPRPDPETIGGFYPSEYSPHLRPKRRPRKRSWWNRFTGRSSPERRGEIPIHGAGRLLDFGCGSGSYLRVMSECNWKVMGIDSSAETIERVRNQLNLPAVAGTLPHPDLAPCSFDLITMWHSLEHVHEPLRVLREAYRLLVPGGRLVVASPNAAGWAAQWFGAEWYALDLPRHLVHFTPQTLGEMLQTAGFQVTKIRSLRHSDWLRSSANLAKLRKTKFCLSHILGSKPIARMASWVIDQLGGSDCIMITAERPLH